ncbi:hypothetical protein BpHYR1_048997 [Brachionus plicatilis]|uniref:Uncharacterized protein n=1 Tax=Brachionus plicatilis TaxID=10195 RepID=A0A3M7PT19_BRAPC|nr:hypothetical protein BpHYR1_048997 [Brachionus plicatilis]
MVLIISYSKRMLFITCSPIDSGSVLTFVFTTIVQFKYFKTKGWECWNPNNPYFSRKLFISLCSKFEKSNLNSRIKEIKEVLRFWKVYYESERIVIS